jgi:tetratricopeptide (TPR) repeat protein
MEEPINTVGEPYPGLRSFRRDETHIFFGREGTISEMVDRLAAHRFLAVTGLSGSGKSSLVKTGLLDALDRGLLVEAGSDWRVVDFRPGAQPLMRMTVKLTRALGKSFSDPELGLIEAKLASGPLGLIAWLDELDFPSDTNILLLVDQFEEIFRYRQGLSGDDIDAFVALLLASAKQRKRRIYVVITMRSDFLGDCARFTDFAETINYGQFLTPRLTREQCKEAIEGPAAVYDGKVEPALVTRMLNDMGGNPDQLPLMQHILMLLWQLAKARSATEPVLTLDDYKALGGIGTGGTGADKFAAGYGMRPSLLRRIFGRSAATSAGVEMTGVHSINGALSDHADRVLAELTPEQQRLAEILFRALTQGEGEGGRDVRRPISLAKAAAIAEVPADNLIPVIEAFRALGVTFLTPLAPEPLRLETIIDISHESLIRQWVKLRAWVRDEYQAAERYRDIERSAKRWNDGLGNLWTKLDLAMARKWRKAERPNPAWAERYGNAYDLAMKFLRKSERYRFWRRGFAVAIIGIPLLLVAGMFYQITVILSALVYLNPAGEFSNFGIPPQAVLKQEKINTETPMTVPGGQVVNTLELKAALETGKLRGAPFILIDALNSPNHETISNAEIILFAGNAGNFHDDAQHQLQEKLKSLTKSNLDMSIVFFCQGVRCWESYNACLRAIHLGYLNVYWYRGGILAWNAADETLANTTAEEIRRSDISSISVKPSTVLSKIPDIILMIWNRVAQSSTANQRIQVGIKGSDFYYQHGVTNVDDANYDEAITDFIKAIALDPENADSYYARGRAYANKDDFDDALADLLKAVDLDPAKNAQVQGILLDPKYVSAYAEHGYAYYLRGDYDRAIQDYSQAIQLDPKNAAVYEIRGEAYYRKGNYDRAIQDYGQAIQLDLKNATAYRNRGNAYYRKGDYDRAIKDYDQEIQLNLDPKYAYAYGNRGDAYYRKGDYDRAIQDYDRAIQLDPKYAHAYSTRGNAYREKGDYDRAIQDYDQAIQLDPKNADAHGERGRLYFYQGNFKAAVAALVRANELKNDPYALIWSYLARERAGENGAAELAANAVRLKTTEWPYPVIELYLGRLSLAQVQSAVSNAEERCEAQFYGGEWHLLRRNRTEAATALQTAVDTCPKGFFEYSGALADLKRLTSRSPIP